MDVILNKIAHRLEVMVDKAAWLWVPVGIGGIVFLAYLVDTFVK
jgi:hypothetical protein